MRIDRTHRSWGMLAASAFAISSMAYFLYATRQPGGPRGSTATGLAFGIAGYALMLFEGLLGARKRVPVWRLGKAQGWMRGHLWLGLITLPLILFHAGFAMRGPLTFVLMMLLFAVYASGILGAALQHYLPSQITSQVPLETIYEEIPHVRQQLLDEADELVGSLEVEVEHDDKVRFRAAYETSIRPFLVHPGKRGAALAKPQKAGLLFESVRRALPQELYPAIETLESICEEERQLIHQRRLYHWLHVWQLVHVPLSIALVVLGGAHAVMALRYMAERKRTTKQLAQRIQWDYYKKSFPIPFWRRTFSIALPALGLLWLGLSRQQAFNAGPLAQAHAIVTNQCESCHALPARWGKTTGDAPCLTCHDAPQHQAQQTFTPACSSCHVEHKGAFQLSRTTDTSCTQCHGNLSTKDGRLQVDAAIASFNSGHPEFAAIRSGHAADPGTLKLNHQTHLKQDLKGPNGPVQLTCHDCHQPNGRSAAMAPVAFEQHCKSCHPLVYDKRFTDTVPHKETAVVGAYVLKQYSAYIPLHPAEVREPVQPNPDLPDRPIPPPPRNAQEWIAQRVEEADRLLWQKTCKECHLLTYPAPSSRPEVPKAQAAVQWMKNARFDHQPHQLVACTECHTQAATSQKTEDVLLPAIATCQKCHYDGPKAAESRCFECHVYHDWSKAKAVRSKGEISQFGR